MQAFLAADWLTPQRALGYCRVVAVVTATISLLWITAALIQGGVDPAGHALGPDFAPFWSAARLALSGTPPLAYDPAHLSAIGQDAFGGTFQADSWTPFIYPPPFLLALLPFATLPYLPALALWLGLSAAAFFWRARALWPGAALPVLAYPGLLINLLNGQNGAFAAALMMTAVATLERRPVLAGICLGVLSCKPQLVLLAPLVLLLFRQWTVLAVAVATAVLLCGASLAVLGTETWGSFWQASAMARHILEAGWAEPSRMVSVFAAAQLFGATPAFCYTVQAASVLAVIVALSRLPHRVPPCALGALIAASVPLVSPYAFDYDLAIQAAAAFWLLDRARQDGFHPGEKLALLAIFTVPLAIRPAASVLGIPLGPPCAAALFLVVWQRAVCVSEYGHLRDMIDQRDARVRQRAMLVAERVTCEEMPSQQQAVP